MRRTAVVRSLLQVRRWAAGVALVLLVVGVVAVGPSEPAGAAAPDNTRPLYLTITGQIFQPSVASNGTKALAVWQHRVGGVMGIYGRIIGANGSGQSTELTIAAGTKNLFNPDVAWTGKKWLVVWQTEFSATDDDIDAAFVTTAGAVGAPIQVDHGLAVSQLPSVASGTGGGSVVVWEDKRNNATESDILGAAVAPDRTVSAIATPRVSFDDSTNPTDDHNPDVSFAAGPGSFRVVWDAAGATANSVGYREFAASEYGHQTLFSTTSTVRAPSIASHDDGPSEGLVVYEVGSGGATDLVATRTTGPTTHSSPFAISSAGGSQGQPSVAWNGEFLVVWKDQRDSADGDIYTARVPSGGTSADGNGVFLTNEAADNVPVIDPGTSADGRFIMTWLAASTTGNYVVATAVTYPAPK
jgi:hypothetical protein